MGAATADRDVLAAALREVGRALAPRRLAAAAAVADDPLRLALPPLAATGPAAGGWCPTTEVLGAYAALYLHAQLEEAGVLPVVEVLAEQRGALALRERATAQQLERFAQGAPDAPTRAERARIYARLFGPGATPAGPDPGRTWADPNPWGSDAPVRADFSQRLLRLATAVVRADADRTRLGRPSPISQVAWRTAAQQLLVAVAAEPGGSLVAWARRIHARTLRAFEVLGDPGLLRQLGSRTPWETLQRLLATADAARREAAARRGAAGQALLRGLTEAADDSRTDAMPGAGSVQAAVRWLVASGLPLPTADTLPPSLLAPAPLPHTAFAAGDPLAEDALPHDTWAAVALP